MLRHLGKRSDDSTYRRNSIVACVVALISVALLSSTAMAQNGDMNCNGAVNFADIPLFVDALLAAGAFGGCDINRADCNGDTLINGRDVQSFVARLLAPTCGPPLVWCNGTCVDTSYNNGHCGACGVTCGPNETCVGGLCEPSQPCPECP